MHSTASKTSATHTSTYRRPTVARRPMNTKGEPFDPTRVSTSLSVVSARIVKGESARTERLLNPQLQPREIGIHTSLWDLGLGHTWSEGRIDNRCGYGCKVYTHDLTGEEVLAHNSAYGCRTTC